MDTQEKYKRLRTQILNRVFSSLRFIPGIGRLRALRPGTDALAGSVVDTFAAFAVVDGSLNEDEVDIILDLLRAAYPEVDHGWLARRLQRSVRSTHSLQDIAFSLRSRLDDAGKLALGLQLWTLVDASGKSESLRAMFTNFMLRLGCANYGNEILLEMYGSSQNANFQPSFERVSFGKGHNVDVQLPPRADGHEFRVYRSGDMVLVRNTGTEPLWVRGRSLEHGNFLRMRERQSLVVPDWTLTHEDLVHFLNVKKTGIAPRIHVSASDKGIIAERTRTRQSLAVVKFGLQVEITAHRPSDLLVGEQHILLEQPIICEHHERLIDPDGASVELETLRKRALEVGGRFRVENTRKKFLISNDASELGSGDLLVTSGLAPKVLLAMQIHAESGRGTIEVIESEKTILVNDSPVKDKIEIEDGALIRLSPRQALRCRFSERLIDEERHLIEELVLEDLIHDFSPESRALDNLNFSIRRGEMMCIIGPSGSGKSTLLGVLSGQLEPTRGYVRLNGVSLYQNREELIRFISRMAQEEALFPQLTVREHLRHAASIRRPTQSAADRERRIDMVLADLGLQSLSHRLVGSPGEKTLSGGERSRLNLGLDLLGASEVLLFDEPISGLSSKDSEHVVETLKALSREKIVISSLHRPSAKVLKLYDKVLLLDAGGRLAFFGTPDEMIAYFRDACAELGISHPSLIDQLSAGADFVFDVLETPLSQIGGGQNPSGTRRFPATFWQERFESETLLLSLSKNSEAPVSRLSNGNAFIHDKFPKRQRRRIRDIFALFTTHFQRSLLSKFRTRGTLYSILLEAPLLAALVGWTLRASPEGKYEFSTALHIPAFLFLSATVAMFLGLTNSATEILRDRPVIRREQNVYPGAGLYVAAKFLSLAILAAAQCLTYLLITLPLLAIRGMLFEHWFWLTLTAWVGSVPALLISSLVKSERAALTAVPLLLVPQMLLAGALVSFREMNRGMFTDLEINRESGGVPVPAYIMPLRYSYEGMVVTQAMQNPFDTQRIRLQDSIEALTSKKELEKNEALRLELLKKALTKLLAAGSTNPEQAKNIASSLRYYGKSGTPEQVKSIKAWPDGNSKDAKPISSFFVNDRIDLMTREAEAQRMDYRIDKARTVFLALKQPLLGKKITIATDKKDLIFLFLFVTLCPYITVRILAMQKRRVK